VAHAVRAQPVVQAQQLIAGRAEAANLLAELPASGIDPGTRGQHCRVHIDPAAAPIDSLQG
jgi:hypothetical protein